MRQYYQVGLGWRVDIHVRFCSSSAATGELSTSAAGRNIPVHGAQASPLFKETPMFRSRTSTTVVSGLVLVALGCVAFGDNISAFIDNTMDSASQMAREASDRATAAPTDAVSVDITGDYYAVTGVAQRDYDAVRGSVQY